MDLSASFNWPGITICVSYDNARVDFNKRYNGGKTNSNQNNFTTIIAYATPLSPIK